MQELQPERQTDITGARFEAIDDLSRHLARNLKSMERPVETEAKPSARVKTRLLNFGVFRAVGRNAEPEVDHVNASADTAPVGSLVVVDGPGKGKGFHLYDTRTEIGRGDGQDVQLDFGDAYISRQGHATILFNPQTCEFELREGGKVNPVRLNGTQVIGSAPLRCGDLLAVGTTILRFTAN